MEYNSQFVDDIREVKEENPFESMMSRFDRAAQLLQLDRTSMQLCACRIGS